MTAEMRQSLVAVTTMVKHDNALCILLSSRAHGFYLFLSLPQRYIDYGGGERGYGGSGGGGGDFKRQRGGYGGGYGGVCV